MSSAPQPRRRVGIVGFGKIGQAIYSYLQSQSSFQVVFVWNRSKEVLEPVRELALHNLEDFAERKPELVIEVAHPSITAQFGALFLRTCDYLVGSPTALADAGVHRTLLETAAAAGSAIYVPAGALWGGEDIQRMADVGSLTGVTVTMRKHPSAFRLSGALAARLPEATTRPVTLYDGPVRQLCPQAPNNVNTMAAAALAAHNIGFDGVIGRLVADPSLSDFHVVEVEVHGGGEPPHQFCVRTVRSNPAAAGAVTGSATYAAFSASVARACGRPAGLHLC